MVVQSDAMPNPRGARAVTVLVMVAALPACGAVSGPRHDAAPDVESFADAASVGDARIEDAAIADAPGDTAGERLDAVGATEAGGDAMRGTGDGGVDSGCVRAKPGLIGWWPGDGNADDLAGGHNGTAVGGVTYASGRVGQAFALDGADDVVSLGNAPALRVSSGDFTVDAWVLFNAQQGDMSIVDKMSASGTNTDGWRLLKQQDQRFWFCFGGGDQNRCVDPSFTVFSTTVVTTGTWFHIAVVKNSSSFAIYVNGVNEDTRLAVPAFVDTNATDLLVGSNSLEGAHLNGLVDEIEIFNRALSSEEIKSIYDAGGATKCK